MSKSALASITAQYTDSENEDIGHEVDFDSENSRASQVIIPKPVEPIKKPEPEVNSNSSHAHVTKAKKKRPKKVKRLVSYQDDTLISDEDGEPNESSESSSEESFDSREHDENSTNKEHADNASPMEVDDVGNGTNDESSAESIQMKAERLQKYSHYGFQLPPEPKGKPSSELMDKIRQLHNKIETTNLDMNRVIQQRKDFRNPSIYEKLIQFCDINEFGTNYPPEIYDPLQWGPESYYEELARVQKNEMVKRQKERKDNDKIEQATALARKVEEEAKKRKSKWDQPAPVKPLLPPALTTTVTGTKGTVISAFGSLPKKPAN